MPTWVRFHAKCPAHFSGSGGHNDSDASDWQHASCKKGLIQISENADLRCSNCNYVMSIVNARFICEAHLTEPKKAELFVFLATIRQIAEFTMEGAESVQWANTLTQSIYKLIQSQAQNPFG